MLKVRVIPTLLWKDVGLVKGVGFDSWRRVGSALPAVKVYNTRDVDELVLLDITATREHREPDYQTVSELCAECFVPMTVGGGVMNLDAIRSLLLAGADKVAINSAAYIMPQLISEAAYRFGSQCVVASVDARTMPDGGYQCFSHSGTVMTGRDPVSWARELERLGAGEILLTSIEKDGTMEGYDLRLVREVVNAVSIPVIASGGAGNYQHMLEAITTAHASAVAAASMFHFTEQTPKEAREYLGRHGVAVRKSSFSG
jgi:cyclase